MAALKSSLHRSLARQITVLVAVLLFIVGLAVSLVSYIQVLRLTRQVASDRLRVLVSQLAPLLGRGPGENLIRLSRAASHPVFVQQAYTAKINLLFDLRNVLPFTRRKIVQAAD